VSKEKLLKSDCESCYIKNFKRLFYGIDVLTNHINNKIIVSSWLKYDVKIMLYQDANIKSYNKSVIFTIYIWSKMTSLERQKDVCLLPGLLLNNLTQRVTNILIWNKR